MLTFDPDRSRRFQALLHTLKRKQRMIVFSLADTFHLRLIPIFSPVWLTMLGTSLGRFFPQLTPPSPCWLRHQHSSSSLAASLQRKGGRRAARGAGGTGGTGGAGFPGSDLSQPGQTQQTLGPMSSEPPQVLLLVT